MEVWIVKKGSGNENVRKHVLPQVDAFFLGLSALRNPLQFISSLGLMLLSWGIAIIETYVILANLCRMCSSGGVPWGWESSPLGSPFPQHQPR